MIYKNTDIATFLEDLDNKRLIVFGAGAIGHQFIQVIDATLKLEIDKGLRSFKYGRFINSYDAYHADSIVEFFVDNDSRRHNTVFNIDDKSYMIFSAEQLSKIKNIEDYKIVITSKYFLEIFIQLSKIKNLQDIDCYIYPIMREDLYQPFWNKVFSESVYRDNVLNYKENLRKLKDIHKGERCFIIGNGPSLKIEDLNKLKNDITFAVNRIYLFFDRTEWRPDYYCVVDNKHLGNSTEDIKKVEAKKVFIPLSIFRDQHKEIEEATYFDVDITPFYPNPPQFSGDISEKIVNGMTVTYMQIQIAVYMGFEEIYLLGTDHSYTRELLPDGSLKYNEGIVDYFQENYSKKDDTPARIQHMNLAYTQARIFCEARGIKIYNATRGGHLESFKRVNFDDLSFE